MQVDLIGREVVPITLALSVRQPYAELIMAGKKKFEYRSLPTKIRERVYVYASRKPAPEEEWKRDRHEPGSLPTGVLVGSVEIVGCQGKPGDYAWRLGRPKRARRMIKPKNRPQPVWFRPF